MAVYTKVDDHMLADFLGRYDHGQANIFKGIAEGVSNSNYYLETTTDRFILTLYEQRAEAEDLPYFLDLMEHLAQKNIPCPLPVRDRNEIALQELAGRNACMITFLKGVSLDHLSPVHCAEAGKALAEMHLALKDFDQVRRNDLSLTDWDTITNDLSPRLDEVQRGLCDTLKQEVTDLTSHWPTNLPSGTIHADLFPDNVLFTGDKLTGLIDFYFACTDFFAYDLAICINAWCFDDKQNFMADEAKAMIMAYDAVRPLSDDEKEALPYLCRGAALRFTLTRLQDWLNPVEDAIVSPKDPLNFLRRLQFFQNNRNIFIYD